MAATPIAVSAVDVAPAKTGAKEESEEPEEDMGFGAPSNHQKATNSASFICETKK